jgi:hypothetical protein
MGYSGLEANLKSGESEQLEYVSIGFVERGAARVDGDTLEVPVYLNQSKEIMLTRLRCPVEEDKKQAVVLAGTSFYVL